MSINSVMGASVNIQANYAVTSSVNTYDTTNVWNGNEDAGELQQQEETAQKQDVGGAKSAQNAAKSSQAQASGKAGETGKAGEAGKSGEASEAGAAAQAEGGQETSETAARTLRLSMADNSKELQAKFNETQQARNDQPTLSQDARRQVMLRNMESMVKMQLAQYTGNEPYSKANYREILGAVTNMQGDGKTSKTKDDKNVSTSSDSSEAGKAEEKDGAYKLYSCQAAKTLAALNTPKGGGDDNFDCVA